MKQRRAFTLLELMTAVAILLVVTSGLLVMFVNCMVMNEMSNHLLIAANDAQYVLEQMKSLAYSEIANYTPPTFTNLNNETVSLTRTVGSTIANVSVNVTWNEKQGQKNFRLSTRFAK